MIACIIRSKALLPHDTIWAVMGAAPIVSPSIWPVSLRLDVPKERYSILVLMLLKQLAEHADNHCWNAKVQEWIQSHGKV